MAKDKGMLYKSFLVTELMKYCYIHKGETHTHIHEEKKRMQEALLVQEKLSIEHL